MHIHHMRLLNALSTCYASNWTQPDCQCSNMPVLNEQLMQTWPPMQDGHEPDTGLAERLHAVAMQPYYLVVLYEQYNIHKNLW